MFPTIEDRVFLVSDHDLGRIYGNSTSPEFVSLGHLSGAESIPALVSIDKLITRHSAIVGSTGSGKSTTVASILAALSDPSRYPSSRILLLDLHGEYARALSDRATVFRVSADTSRAEQPLCIPYWALSYDELLPLTFGDLDESCRSAVADEIVAMKRIANQPQTAGGPPRYGTADAHITVDTPIPWSIQQLWFTFHCLKHATHVETPGKQQSRDTWALELDPRTNLPVQSGDPIQIVPPRFLPAKDERNDPEKIRLSKCLLNIGRPLEALAGKLRDPRFDFLFSPGQWKPALDGSSPSDLDSLLHQWIGGSRRITILDISGIPTPVLNHLVGALLRLLYDALFWSRNLPEGGRERPLLVVLEEAHTYLGSREPGPAASAVRRIAKEGRKYGFGIMLVSQRPAEIDQTILAQCGTLIAMRLTNTTDRGHVSSAAPDNLEGLFSMLPALRTGEAIIVGEGVSLPIRTLIEPPPRNRRPDSVDPDVVINIDEHGVPMTPGGWNHDRPSPRYDTVIHAWRSHMARPERVLNPANTTMQRQPVTSSSIASIGYDAPSTTLEVEFTNGQIYQYFDVPESVHTELMHASSHGEYFARNIRSKFQYARL